jgi:hypothetical protein
VVGGEPGGEGGGAGRVVVGAVVRVGAPADDGCADGGAAAVVGGSAAGWLVRAGAGARSVPAGRARGRLRDAVAGADRDVGCALDAAPEPDVDAVDFWAAGVASAIAAAMPPVARMAATATPRVTRESRRSARSRSCTGGCAINLSRPQLRRTCLSVSPHGAEAEPRPHVCTKER